MDPYTGQEMKSFVFREKFLPGEPLISVEMLDMWGFEDDFQSFKEMSGEDAVQSGQELHSCTEGETKSGVPFWVTEITSYQNGEALKTQNYYFFPNRNYKRAFIMRGFALKNAYESMKSTFEQAALSFRI